MSIVVRTLSEQAYQLVRERIVSGALAGGAPVRQDAIAEDLGVSKIPLREALTRLEQDGLLISSPNKGYVVRTLTAAEAEEVFDLRLKLEPEAAARACLAADALDRRAARDALEALGHDAPANPPDHVLNRAFHLVLTRPGVGLITRQLLERLHVVAERYVRVHLEPDGRPSRAAAEHAEILAAWLARDDRRVADLTAAHVRGTLGDVRAQLAMARDA
jgi:DNA-binding GntR family transcriptional regulator